MCEVTNVDTEILKIFGFITEKNAAVGIVIGSSAGECISGTYLGTDFFNKFFINDIQGVSGCKGRGCCGWIVSEITFGIQKGIRDPVIGT